MTDPVLPNLWIRFRLLAVMFWLVSFNSSVYSTPVFKDESLLPIVLFMTSIAFLDFLLWSP